jgi:hypothetical protein
MSMQIQRNFVRTAVNVAASLAIGVGAAHAGEREDLETLRQTTLNLIQILVQQGVLTQEKANQLTQQAEQKAKEAVAAQAQAKPEPGVVRVQLVPESVKKQIADQVREEVVAQAKQERWGDENAVPEWVDRIKIEGELRVGYQADRFAKSNRPPAEFNTAGQLINNTTEDRDRMRMRATLGVNAKVTPAISAGLRLTTGSLTDPTSTTQTQGIYDNKYTFSLDRAFLKINSDDTLPWLTVSAGRIPNPWFSTNLVWNDSLNFEGVALTADPYTRDGSVWRPYATVGLFPIQDVESSNVVKGKSKWLYGAQIGTEWVPDAKTRGKVGLAYYDYRDISGVKNSFNNTAYDKTAPDFRQKGNTMFDISGTAGTTLWGLAADYQVLNLTGVLDMNLFNPAHVILTGDYVENIGASRSRTAARTNGAIDRDLQTKGYLARVAVGMPTMLLRGDWQLSLAYRYLEADAVLDAFTDSDFHLGGTNNKGYILGGQYGLGKNSWITARYMSSNEIGGSTQAGAGTVSNLGLAIDVFQVYFNARF